MAKQVTDIQKRRAFLIHQVVRLTDTNLKEAEKLDTPELERLERNYYHDKYDSHGKPEYTPSTL